MSNSSGDAGVGFLLMLATIGSWLASGYLAWNWVEPDNFVGAFLFLFAWAFFGYVIDIVIGAVLTFIFGMFK